MSDQLGGVAFAGATTTVPRAGELEAFLGGFVAAEGSFNRTGNKFRFAIVLAATDANLCELAAALFGAGHVYSSPRRKPHFHDEAIFAVQALEELLRRVVPFMDVYLPPSKKRLQYLDWKRQLLDYWEHEAKRRRVCTADGCEELQRAKGYCRNHYYVHFRK